MEVLVVILICLACAAVGSQKEVITIERGGCVLSLVAWLVPGSLLTTYFLCRWLA